MDANIIHSLIAARGFILTMPATPEQTQALAEIEWALNAIDPQWARHLGE